MIFLHSLFASKKMYPSSLLVVNSDETKSSLFKLMFFAAEEDVPSVGNAS